MSGKNNHNYKTGLSMKDNPYRKIYITWKNIKGRCYRKNHPKYHRYGGRGIKVCDEWLDKETGVITFLKWSLSHGWKKGLTLDRIDNDGNYCPENCQWITLSANSRKKSTTKISYEEAQKIRLRKEEKVEKLAKEYNVCDGTIWFIINNFTHVEEGLCSKKIKQRNENNYYKPTATSKNYK